jgi:hypothetical protein
MPAEELTPEAIAEAATQPASASVDGQSAAAVSIGDQIRALQFQKTQTGLDGTNTSGGPKSPWKKLRLARAKNQGAV